jgi:PAS domain S-box-containing protein
MPSVGRRQFFRVIIATLLVAAAIAVQLRLPQLPPFIALPPAVLLAAFLGGRWTGAAALTIATLSVLLERVAEPAAALGPWDLAAMAGFVAGGILSIAVVDLHHKAVARFSRERRRLKAALAAAHAAVWELSPDGRLFWDENFYRLVGLDPAATPPATSTFLTMVHPEDRGRMAEARQLMDKGLEPPRVDEYRLTRPDGEMIWLENHRTRVLDEGEFNFIGITQDISRRKIAEERVQGLLREADHRAKNQFTVISALARETSRTAKTAAEFEEAFTARLQALARSHDLMIQGEWREAGLRQLIVAHMEPFGVDTRCELVGPEVTVSASAAQYLGIAFHELATNAAKHGSMASGGTIRITWKVDVQAPKPRFELTWEEVGGPSPKPMETSGFGTKVLLELVPAAFAGKASRELTPDGLIWTITAPLAGVMESAAERGAPALATDGG